MINAAIVSTDLPWDGLDTRNCHNHVLRRDYRLVALLRNFNQLDEVVDELGVEVVVFPTRVIEDAGVLGDDTTKILRRRNVAIGRYHVPAPEPQTDNGVREIHFVDQSGPSAGPEYDTAPILPRGNDGGFAERFLNDRRRGRDT